MATYPDSVQIFANLNSVWTDISQHVVGDISFKWGISGNTPLDRLAGTGSMKIVLNNESGVYSPDSLSTLSGWASGTPIKLVVTYKGVSFTRFYGRIDDFILDNRVGRMKTVKVTVLDWIDYSAKQPIMNEDIELNKRGDEAVGVILTTMPIQPLATSYDTGINLFPAVFDTVKSKSKAYAEFSKIASSELGYIYLKKDKTYGETLTFEGNHFRNGTRTLTTIPKIDADAGYLLKDDGFKISLSGTTGSLLLSEVDDVVIDNTMMSMSVLYGSNLINHMTIKAFPKKVDNTYNVLFSLNTPMYVGNGEEKVFRALYSDPIGGAQVNAMPGSMLSPVHTTDYKFNVNNDGSGTNITDYLYIVAQYGSEGITYTVRNVHPTENGWITFLQARGFGIYAYNPIENVEKDNASIALYGSKTEVIDQKYNRELVRARQAAKTIVEENRNRKKVVERVNMLANTSPFLMQTFLYSDVGDMIRIKNAASEIDSLFYIHSIECSITEGGIVKYSFVVKSTVSLLLGLSMISCIFNKSTNTDYIDYGYIPEVSNLQYNTVSAWINMSEAPTSGGYQIVGSFSDAGGYTFGPSSDKRLVFYQKGTTGAGQWYTATNTILPGTWYHVMVTRDTTVSTNVPKLYINGVEMAVTTGATLTGTLASDAGANFIIGAVKTTSLGTTYMFKGRIVDARVYNRILSSLEAAQMFNDGKSNLTITDGLVFNGPSLRTEDVPERINRALSTNDKIIDSMFGAIGDVKGTPKIISDAIGSYSYSNGGTTPVASVTWSHAISSANNRLLVVGVSKRAVVGTQVGSVTYGGVALTKLTSATGSTGAGFPSTELWYLVAPAVGTANIIVTLASGTDFLCVGATDFIDVNQATPFTAPVTYTAASGSVSTTISSAVGSTVVDVLSYYYTGTPVQDADQFSLWNVKSDGTWSGLGSTKLGAASVTMNYTIPSGPVAHIVASINHA